MVQNPGHKDLWPTSLCASDIRYWLRYSLRVSARKKIFVVQRVLLS